MPANPTPANHSELLARCHDLLSGCRALEAEVGLKQHTAAAVQSSLDAAQSAMSAVGWLKEERGRCRAALRKADADGEKVIGRCRLRLAAIFGHTHNVQWEAAGFHGRTTRVPEVQDRRVTLLAHLAAWFASEPARESTDMGATAALCRAAHDALRTARSGVNDTDSRLRAAVQQKNRALAALRHRMRGLITELWILLPADDTRWKRFGLNIPERDSMPRPVKTVTLLALGRGNIHARWSPARHAKRFRVQVRLPGAADFATIATVHQPETLLRDLPPGQLVEVRVIAANGVGEASPSAVATGADTGTSSAMPAFQVLDGMKRSGPQTNPPRVRAHGELAGMPGAA